MNDDGSGDQIPPRRPGNTTFWAISDVNAAELRLFAELVRARLS